MDFSVHSDETVAKFKGQVALDYDERKAVLEHIKWVDEVLDDVPWYPTLEWMALNNIDYVIGDEHAYENYAAIPFRPVRQAGRFISMPREEGTTLFSLHPRLTLSFFAFPRKREPYRP